jgi:hypothetical protein
MEPAPDMSQNVFDVFDPTRLYSYSKRKSFAPSWDPATNPELVSYLSWAIGTANAKLLSAMNDRFEHQNRIHATANAAHVKISLLEKKLTVVQQEIGQLRKKAARPPAPTKPQSTPPAPTAPGEQPALAQNQSYAAAAASAPVDPPFTTVENKKKKKEPKPTPLRNRTHVLHAKSSPSSHKPPST